MIVVFYVLIKLFLFGQLWAQAKNLFFFYLAKIKAEGKTLGEKLEVDNEHLYHLPPKRLQRKKILFYHTLSF